MADPLRHHGDAEVRGSGLLDLAVNVHPAGPPPWLLDALRDSLDDVAAYPDPTAAERALEAHHGRARGEVLATAGAAEAFSLVARLRGQAGGRDGGWRRPVVVHPQFTEPHAALEQAGHRVTAVELPAPYALQVGLVPPDADLVVVGNPTNPTGVLHPAEALRSLVRPGRLVVVDEAFMDVVPGETQTLTRGDLTGLLVVRSLTKQWSVPGVRAGYVVGPPAVVADLRRAQVPWSVAAAAAAAITSCCTSRAVAESARRTAQVVAWRADLEAGLDALGVERVASQASFVLARLGAGVREDLRAAGIAVRRCDTFPGLDASWARIAVRPPEVTHRLLDALAPLLPR